MPKKTKTLQGSGAINDSNTAERRTVGSIKLRSWKYAVNFESVVNFHYKETKLNQVLLFSCAPLTTNNSERWYFFVNTSQGIQITAQENKPIYAVILDQMSCSDNIGSMTINLS